MTRGLLIAAILVGVASVKAAPAWEAALAPGAEKDPLALNAATGEKGAAVLEMVRGAVGELHAQEFAGLKARVPHDGVFRVFFKKEGMALPPDMGGTGPFYVFKTGGSYYLLTRRNFALLFGPLRSGEEVPPFVKAFDKVFLNPQADLILSAAETQGFQKVAPPAVSEILEADDGWDVRAILFSPFRVMAFYEERLRVSRDGVVEVKEKARVIKELGPGIMY